MTKGTKENGQKARKQLLQDMAALDADNEQARREEEERNRPPVICLGYDGCNHVFYSTSTRRLYRLKAERINWPNMLDMAPRAHWERWLFPREAEAGAAPGKRELVAAAQERLLDDAREKTFSPDAMRARGVWPAAGGGWLYNAGASCWQIPDAGGKPEEVQNIRPPHIYTKSQPLPAPDDSPLTDEEGARIVDLLTTRPWSMPGAGDLLAGWIVAALLAGCTPMRPHVWVTAPATTGKTTLKNDIAALLGAYVLTMEGIPTEAAVRQHRNSDCLPVLLDEIEPGENKNNHKSIAEVLELMRNAAYEGKICRGNTDGTGSAFLMKCNFILFSVADNIDRDSDATRILSLRLVRRNTKALAPLWERQKACRDMVQDKAFHGRLMARVLACLPVYMENQKNLAAALMEAGADARRADMFSILLAGRHALTSHAPMTEEDIKKAARILTSYENQSEQESDFTRCLAVMVNHVIDIHGIGKRTVAAACELVDTAASEIKEDAQAALRTVGLRWKADKNALAVDTRAAVMQRIYKETQWSNGKIKPVLAEGCQKNAPPNESGVWIAGARFPGTSTPIDCIFIPRELILAE